MKYMKTIRRTKKHLIIKTAKNKFKDKINEVTFFASLISPNVFFAGILTNRTETKYILSDGLKLEKSKYIIINKTIQL